MSIDFLFVLIPSKFHKSVTWWVQYECLNWKHGTVGQKQLVISILGNVYGELNN